MRAHQILDPLPIGACVLAGDLSILYWNERFEDWTGLSREEVVGKALTTVFPGTQRKRVLGRIQSVLRGGPPAFFSAQLHGSIIPARLPNGAERKSNTTVSLMPEAGSEPTVLLVSEDVTDLMARLSEHESLRALAATELEERKRAEARLRRSTTELARSNADLADFARVVAHDLQAPIRQMLSWSELLVERLGDDLEPMLQKCVDHIGNAGANMQRLIKDVLDY